MVRDVLLFGFKRVPQSNAQSLVDKWVLCIEYRCLRNAVKGSQWHILNDYRTVEGKEAI